MCKTYVAGPMDDVSIDESRDWREMLTEKLSKIGIEVLSPISKYGDDYGKIRVKFSKWKNSGNIDAIRQYVSRYIIMADLKLVKKCDFVTLYIPAKGSEICGSYGEGTHAFYLGRPVLIVTTRRLKPLSLPKWIVGCSTRIFTSWDEYFEYVKENW